MSFVQVQVEAYSGYRANERPLAFILNDRRHEITKILDRWYEGGLTGRDQKLDYFKVQTAKGLEFILRWNPLFEVWSVMLPTSPKT